MNNPSKKVCKLALLSIGSIVVLFICSVIIIQNPGYLHGTQNYKSFFYISKLLFYLSPVISVTLGHLALIKIEKSPQLLSGKISAIIGFVFGYIFLGLFLAVFILFSQSRVCDPGIMRTRSTISGLNMALDRYKHDFGQFPKGTSKDISNELTGFRDSPSKPDDIYLNSSKWRGPYFGEGYRFKDSQRNQAILDPWGKPYNFDFKNDEIIIWSCGPNRINENGKGDDISNKPK